MLSPHIFALSCCLSLAAVAAEPHIIAHRGASGDAPENTMAAFNLAFEQAADGIEGDFYLTKDQHIIALHDGTTKRTTGGASDLKPGQTTLEALRELDVGAWKDERYRGEKMPTLEEVLKALPAGKEFFLEIKSGPEIVPHVVKAIQADSVPLDQITIICFQQPVLAALKKAAPTVKSIWLTGIKPNENGQPQPSAAEAIEIAKRLDIEGIGFSGHESVKEDYIRAIKDAGLIASVWTIDDPAAARRFRDWGVDYITTNLPAKIRTSLAPQEKP